MQTVLLLFFSQCECVLVSVSHSRAALSVWFFVVGQTRSERKRSAFTLWTETQSSSGCATLGVGSFWVSDGSICLLSQRCMFIIEAERNLAIKRWYKSIRAEVDSYLASEAGVTLTLLTAADYIRPSETLTLGTFTKCLQVFHFHRNKDHIWGGARAADLLKETDGLFILLLGGNGTSRVTAGYWEVELIWI